LVVLVAQGCSTPEALRLTAAEGGKSEGMARLEDYSC
jgi:hypothetical protein